MFNRLRTRIYKGIYEFELKLRNCVRNYTTLNYYIKKSNQIKLAEVKSISVECRIFFSQNINGHEIDFINR